jgi:hypothetical protein
MVGLLALCGAACALVAAAPAKATTVSFPYTGAEQEFAAPAGVHGIAVKAIGGKGENAASGSGGLPAEVIAGVTVTPGETIYVEVGGNGSEGGFNGGGTGGAFGGAMGGGASDIRTAPGSTPLSTEDTRLLVAAGGGGGAGNGVEHLGADGGDAGSSGEADEFCGNEGGGPGSAGGGGTGGFGEGGVGEEGHLGLGGDGSDTSEGGGGGGGGGGGYYGGGGGGAGFLLCGGGGGGGGSSLVPEGGLSGTTAMLHKIEISYTPPPSIEIGSPTEGATYAQGQSVNAAYVCLANEGVGLKSCAAPVASGAAIDTATPGEHSFTVNAEDNKAGQSSKTVTYTVAAPPPIETTPPAQAASVPKTKIDSHPKKKIKTKKRKVKVKFAFSSDVAGATFECKLDRHAFAPCRSPKTYKVKLGKHTFSVTAAGAGGTDPSPATFKFKVKKKK